MELLLSFFVSKIESAFTVDECFKKMRAQWNSFGLFGDYPNIESDTEDPMRDSSVIKNVSRRRLGRRNEGHIRQARRRLSSVSPSRRPNEQRKKNARSERFHAVDEDTALQSEQFCLLAKLERVSDASARGARA